MKDRLKKEITLGCRVAVNGNYSQIGVVEALGEDILYLEDGSRHSSRDVFVVTEDSVEKWMDDNCKSPNIYRTLCGQRTFCDSPEEKAEDLLVRAYMLAKDGKLDDYMSENYNLDRISSS